MRVLPCSGSVFAFWFTFAIVASTGSLQAQSSVVRSASDQSWLNVADLSRSARSTKLPPVGLVAPNRQAGLTAKAEREARAQKFKEVAQSAREFHVKNPDHPKASEAKKIEALAMIDSITPRNRAYELSALALARSFRENPANPAAARFEVAHAIESREISRKTLGRPWYSHPALGEMMLDKMRREFGDLPQLHGDYLAFAEHTNCDHGRDVALRIVQSTAPASVKTSARRLLDRYALVRRPLDFPLTPEKGRPTTLGELAGKTTFVCFWDGKKHPEGPPGLHDLKKKSPPNTKWVYVSVGALGQLPKGSKPLVAPAGTTCVEPLGWKSPLVAKLRLSQLPYVFVLDDKNRLSGYGRIDEFPALNAGIGRPILP